MLICLRSATLLLLLFSWFRITRTAATNAASTPISINQNELFNGTLTAVVPTGFEAIVIVILGSKFLNIDCFHLAVTFLAGIATQEPTDQIRPVQRSSGDLIIGVSVSGTPPGTRGVQVRYVAWGIYAAVSSLIAEGQFQSTIYELKMQGTTVGKLAIYKKPQLSLPSGEATNNDTTQDVPYLSPLNDTDPTLQVVRSTNDSALAPVLVDFQFIKRGPRARPLTPSGIFTNILAVLLVVLEHSESQPITELFLLAIGGSGVVAAITPPETSKSLSTPPFLTYTILSQCMRYLSDALVRMHYWYEFRIKIIIDGVDVGGVQFEPQP